MSETTEKQIEMRKLMAKDVMPMVNIIKKIGVKEFKACFESEDVKQIMKQKGEVDLKTVGIKIVMDLATIVLENLPSAEQDIFNFLSGLTGKEKKEIEEMNLADFFELIVAVFKKEEFKDFIKVVSKLFK